MQADLDGPPTDRHSSTILFPSPSAVLVSSHGNRIILRTVQDLQILRTWTLPFTVPAPPKAPATTSRAGAAPPASTAAAAPPADLLTSFSVSPLAPYLILAYAARDKVAYILHPQEQEPVARIDVGAEGAVGMAWSGKGDTIMSWSASHVSALLQRLTRSS